MIQFSEVKKQPYTDINPNGRLPAIEDPNNDFTIWESGACVLYLVDRYDKDHKISFPHGSKEAYLAQQWLIFQASGQGPYYGQRIYFERYHSEQLPSVKERFTNEIKRVTGVLNDYLGKQKSGGDGPWLVGDKFSYADLSFINWQYGAQKALPKEEFDPEQYPHVKDWLDRMAKRPAIKKILDENDKFMKEFMARMAKGEGGH